MPLNGEEIRLWERSGPNAAQASGYGLIWQPIFLKGSKDWWRRVDSNHGPTDYETVALAT